MFDICVSILMIVEPRMIALSLKKKSSPWDRGVDCAVSCFAKGPGMALTLVRA